MKNRLSPFLLAAFLTAVLAACGGDDSPDDDQTPDAGASVSDASTPVSQTDGGAAHDDAGEQGDDAGPLDDDAGLQDGGEPDGGEVDAGSDIPRCGDGLVNAEGETCDGKSGVPLTCFEFDPFKVWLEGGAPGCADDCASLIQGTCVEASCGDGVVTGETEACDGEEGVPATCEELAPAKEWRPGGRPACAPDCSAVLRGTCRSVDEREVTFVNWNVQVDYATWGASLVPPRAEKMEEMIRSWQTEWPRMPAAIAIVEVSPSWHHPQYTAMFNSLGYYWADEDVPIKDKWNGFECGEDNENVVFDLESGQEDANAASCFLFTSLLYRKADFDLVEADYAKLEPEGNRSPFVNNKVAAFCAVLSEKATGQEFIACSTHWWANNGVQTGNGLQNIVGPVVDNERLRIGEAKIAAEFVRDMRRKHPDAHVFFGGDFNTIDLDIVFGSPAASMLLGGDWDELVSRINLYMTGGDYAPLEPGFRSSHWVFEAESGLQDARTMALADGLMSGEGDVKTTSDPNIPDILANLYIPVVIDYGFYSSSMELTDYRVVQDGEGSYEAISDHYPLRTTYAYQASEIP